MRVSLGALLAAWTVTSSALSTRDAGPIVDLGYASYQGSYSSEYDLNVFKGIRYAAAPVGKLRWQAPQPPPSSSEVVAAVDQPPFCPQSGAYGLPEIYGFNSAIGDEDCLFLNVYAPPNARNLPVLVWIHGGGYQLFAAVYDPSVWINTNDNKFIVVEIQYRLGAFGFLSSSEVKSKGALNAGLLDQRYAIKWVQKHISKFGGDAKRVTIAGESSGAGSVVHHSLAYGGREENLFNNIIASSPYLPPIYRYDEQLPSSNFDAFVNLAGCGKGSAARKKNPKAFDCLVAADTLALQNASGTVSTTIGYYGSFSWLPVIDDDFIRQRPSTQLLFGRVSGKRLLVGTMANEGVPLTNPQVETRAAYNSFISNTFPHFSKFDVAALNAVYKVSSAQEGDNGPRYDTLGDQGPTVLTQSSYATGIQQTAFTIAAETTFVCPAQWFADAYSISAKQVWKYQYSANPNHHGSDLSAYFSVGAEVPNLDFRTAFQKIWGNFIINNTPIISAADATAGYANATAPIRDGKLAWPQYSFLSPQFMNLNTTGGEASLIEVTDELSYYVRVGAGIVNSFKVGNDWTWEGGRAVRCTFWRGVASRVPQ